MYCSYCAAVLVPGQAACPKCGRAMEAAAAGGSRPSSVRVATILLLVSEALVFLMFASLTASPGMISRLPGLFLLRTFGFFVIAIVLIVCLWQRQGWARIAMALFVLWGVANLAISIMWTSRSVGIAPSFLVAGLADVLRLCALYLLFKPESNAWYRKSAGL